MTIRKANLEIAGAQEKVLAYHGVNTMGEDIVYMYPLTAELSSR